MLDAPGNVLLVLLGKRRKRQGRSGDVDPLRVPQGPPDDDAAADVLALHPLDLQMQGAVVDVDVLPGEDLPRQKGIIDVDALGGPDEGFPAPREDDGVPADQRDLLENCGIDSTIYTGYALGMGIERITMLKYRINDIRMFFENDVRFLQEFCPAI